MSNLAAALEHSAQGFLSDIRSEWSRFPNVPGNADITFRIKNDDYNTVTGEYAATGQKMWILEHGSGSKMDKEDKNPDLAEYKRSELWNPERGKEPGADPSGTEIRTRPRSVNGQGWGYLDLDLNKRRGSGAAMPHGLNAEWSMKGLGSHRAVPQEPQHIIHDTLIPPEGTSARVKAMEDEMYLVLGNVIDRAILRGEAE